MKKQEYSIINCCIVLCILSFKLNAKVFTVAVQSNPQIADYNSIQEAHDAANSGDTIYLYPSQAMYSSAFISKRLTILGTGFQKVNDYTDCSKIKSSDSIIFEENSLGSIISSVIGDFKIRIKASNILIQKCKLSKIYINSNLSNILISNCIINSKMDHNAIRILDNTSLVGIKNNIFLYEGYWSFDVNEFNSTFYVGTNSSAIIQNNIVKGYNILYSNYSNTVYLSNNIYYNNYCGWDRWQNVGPTTVNTNWIFYCEEDINPKGIKFQDEQKLNFHLKEDSPAKNAGTNNEDLGIYTGDFPFVDDGAPPLPTIYSLKTPSVASQTEGLSIELKAKTNK